jgi:hypothetical protein
MLASVNNENASRNSLEMFVIASDTEFLPAIFQHIVAN